MDWFIWLLFGHLFGDYVFQNNWMALNKKVNKIACVLHCSVYTITVMLFLVIGAGLSASLLTVFLIFSSHYILDSTSLVEKWMRFYKIRSWSTYVPISKDKTKHSGIDINKCREESFNIEESLVTVFGAFIYVVIDNTLHLFAMFLILKYLI